ncbi:MAG TPA: translation initiation factor IF-2 [Candidatus Cloacimonetes bacterium]|nr:translation initiation factor IF-2 [Candidatus Cloacimonadota bacterium]
MDQIRVYELARELKISPQALISILRTLKVKVKSHMSHLEDDTVAQVKQMFQEQLDAAKARQKQRKNYQQQQRQRRLEKLKKEEKKQTQKKEDKKEEKKEPGKRPEKRQEKPKYPPKKHVQKDKEKPKAKEKPTAGTPKTTTAKEKDKQKAKSYKDKKQKILEEKQKKFFDQQKIKGNIKATLTQDPKRKKYKKEKTEVEEEITKIVISEFTSVSELAKIMDKNPTAIVAKFMELGKMVTINQRLDNESLIMICDEFNFDVEFEDQYGKEILEVDIEDEDKSEVKDRPPIVVVMGHVDHGKTSILDYIRKANVIAGEAGGITQHIGAYQVEFNDKKITFIDTPGHEAFTAMRARGAEVTDIAVIVIAADDGVMPQTMEAIDHAKAAGIPLIIAINKIDKPTADVEKVKVQLSQKNIRLQGWGGDIESVECSAKTGEGIEGLLETILLVSEVEELTARYNQKAEGTVIETKLDKGKGPLATVLIRNGVLKPGDIIICGAQYGRVRLMLDERQNEVKECPPSGVVQILGLNGVPKAGDTLNVVTDERKAKDITSKRQQVIRQRQIATGKGVTLDNIFDKIQESEITSLNLIVKGDTDGSVGALCDTLQKIRNEEVGVNVVHRGVGGIVEADIDLATASKAIIIGFHVRPNAEARAAAEVNHVDIRLYDIIYEAIDEVKKSLEGLLAPTIREEHLGTAEVREIFKISKIGTIAGCMVTKGKITSNALMRLFHDDIKVYEGTVENLKRFKNEVKEVTEGQECGISIVGFNDIKVGDVIDAYIKIEEKKKLEL